jgi:hypothetical protein
MTIRVGLRHLPRRFAAPAKPGIIAVSSRYDHTPAFYSRFFNGVEWESEKTNVSSASAVQGRFSVSAKDGKAYLAYCGVKDGTKLIYEKYENNAWGDETELVADPHIASEYPTISVAENGELYVIWGSTYYDKVYYRRFNGSSWEPLQTWVIEYVVDWAVTWSAFGNSYDGLVGCIYRAQPTLAEPFYLRFIYVDVASQTYSSPSNIDDNDYNAAGVGFQRKSFYANGRFWVFYKTHFFGVGTYHDICYRTSTDGTTWTDEVFVTKVWGTTDWGEDYSLYFDGTYFHYVAKTDLTKLRYRRGLPNADGSIVWSAAEQVVTDSIRTWDPTITVDTQGYPFIGYADAYYPWVTKSITNDGTWQTDEGYPFKLNENSDDWYVSVLRI